MLDGWSSYMLAVVRHYKLWDYSIKKKSIEKDGLNLRYSAFNADFRLG